MKVAALAAFGVLIAFSAGAAQQVRQFVSPATTCDNDGHCKTASADVSAAVHSIRPKPQKTIANVVQPLPPPRPSQTDSQSQRDQPSVQQSQETQQAQLQAEQAQDQQQAQPPPEQAQQIQQVQRPQLQTQQVHALDANGNKGIVISHKTGRVHASALPMLRAFRPISTIWKTIMARACCS